MAEYKVWDDKRNLTPRKVDRLKHAMFHFDDEADKSCGLISISSNEKAQLGEASVRVNKEKESEGDGDKDGEPRERGKAIARGDKEKKKVKVMVIKMVNLVT